MFIEARWPNGVACPTCGSLNVQERPTRKPQPFRCRDCRKDFSVKTDTVMQGSNIPLHKWALAVFLLNTSLKGVSSMKLHRDLGSSLPLGTWFRKAWETDGGLFPGRSGRFGGKERNKHDSKKLQLDGERLARAVVGIKDRETGQVSTAAVASTDAPTLQGFVEGRTEPTAQVYTDEAAAYNGLNRSHETVKHSAREYVHGMAHTNGIESHWAMLKRGYVGVYHQMSAKHLPRYVAEFEGRHNSRSNDTINQVHNVIRGMDRLRYQDLIA